MSILGRKVPTKVVAAIAGLMLLAAIAGLTLLVALLPARSSTPTREVTLGTAFEHKVPVAAVDGRPALIIRTLQPPASDVQLGTPDRVFGVFTLSGLYVGMIPVMVGLLWFPFLKRLSVRVGGMDFLLALTVGLLAFLLVDGAHEGFESAELLPKSFQGACCLHWPQRVRICCSKVSARGCGRGGVRPGKGRAAGCWPCWSLLGSASTILARASRSGLRCTGGRRRSARSRSSVSRCTTRPRGWRSWHRWRGNGSAYRWPTWPNWG